MWIERTLQDKITRLSLQKPVILITGARQVGKTELLRHAFPQHGFASLDLPSEAETADREGVAFLESHPPPLIIDEAQYAPGLFRPLKGKVDLRRNEPGQYLLTGSQKFTLMKEVSESLAGRIALVELEPLSFREIRSAIPEFAIDDAVVRGGYPELYRDLRFSAQEFYRSYVATYLERDLRAQLQVGNLRDFERFLRACALRSGQLLNRSDLARDIGISPNTANEWLSALVASNIAFLLEPWFSNQTKSLVKSPKLYLSDTGLLCFLCGIGDADTLRKSPLRGAIWETFVFSELRKQRAVQESPGNLFFYRERQLEADFLVERGGRFELYDAKWSQQPDRDDFRILDKVADRLGPTLIDQSLIIARIETPYPVASGKRAIGPLDL